MQEINLRGTRLCCGLALALWSSLLCAEPEPWPGVMPLKQSMYFSRGAPFASGTTIFARDGNPLYLLECHDYSYKRDYGFLYSGSFECRLTALYGQSSYSTLLTDDPHQSRDWQSRGRFLGEELAGDCATYPEFGAVRHFRLRKMSITFAMRDVKFEQPSIDDNAVKSGPEFNSFRFDLTVMPSPSAMSAIAEPVPYRYPPYKHPDAKDDFTLDCSQVLREH